MKRLLGSAHAFAFGSALLLAVAAGAQTHPNLEVGFGAEKAYELGDIEQVGLFNGNLSLTIPIGRQYPVHEGFSYGLTLVYNSKVWDFEQYTVHQGGNPEPVEAVEAIPSRRSNAGLGFRLSLGQLVGPEETTNWGQRFIYVGPDGGEHPFFETLHLGDIEQEGVLYSRDSSYLRLRRLECTETSDIVEIDSPDGSIRRFERSTCPDPDDGVIVDDPLYRLTEIRSPFGRNRDDAAPFRVMVEYGQDDWTLTDPHGRQQVIRFIDVGGSKVVDRVDLTAFGGDTASYVFAYSLTNIAVSCKDTYPLPAHIDDPPNPPQRIDVPLLTSVTQPDGSKWDFQFDGVPAYHAECTEPILGETAQDLPGVLRRVRLPTGGIYAWEYQEWLFPNSGQGNPPNLTVDQTVGLKRRRRLDPDGSCPGLDGCIWSYLQETPLGQVTTSYYEGRSSSIRTTTPLGHQTVTTFAAPPNRRNSDWHGWQYGLMVMEEVYDGDVTTGRLLRRTEIDYEHDPIPTAEGGAEAPAEEWYNTNRREPRRSEYVLDVIADRTYGENCAPDVSYESASRVVVRSEFDGVGNYRTVRYNAYGEDWDAVERTERTRYNPSLPDYVVNIESNTASGFTPLSVDGPWVLGTYDAKRDDDHWWGTVNAARFCFDSETGALEGRREIVRNLVAPVDVDPDGVGVDPTVYLNWEQGNDVVIRYQRSAGNVVAERYYGGDQQGGIDTPSCGPPSVPPEYVRLRNFVGGVARHEQWVDPADESLEVLQTLDQSVEVRSGLVSSSRDASGVATAYQYDAMGRLTRQQADGEAATVVTIEPFDPVEGSRPRVRVSKGQGRIDRWLVFDPFGRVFEQIERLPDGMCSGRRTTYLSGGEVAARTEPGAIRGHVGCPWPPNNHDAVTEYSDFDPLGRPRFMLGPGVGAGRDRMCSVYGDSGSVISRTKVGTLWSAGEPGEEWAERLEVRDRFGRLTSASAGVGANYRYDAAGRLIEVSQGEGKQLRTFDYDGRGQLRAESHPERDVPTTFHGFDSLGLYHRREQGGIGISYAYDKAGRQLAMSSDVSLTPLRSFSYGVTNFPLPGGDLSRAKGKLLSATAVNRLPGDRTLTVTESYEYGGPGGRTSKRTTATQGARKTLFTQGFTYDDLGEVIGVFYPTCHPQGRRRINPTSPCFSKLVGRTERLNYEQGRVTEIRKWLPEDPSAPRSITVDYHINGALASIARPNGTRDDLVLDPFLRGRPRQLTVGGPGGSVLWDSGIYELDGTGNITAIGADRYGYDEASRLRATDLAQYGRWEYDYDSFGNLIWIDDVNAGEGRNIPADLFTNRLSEGTYDASGNLLALAGNTYEYDHLDQMIRVDTGQDSAGDEEWVYAYTAGGERIWSLRLRGQSPYRETWTLRGLEGSVLRELRKAHQGGSWTSHEYLWLASRLVASAVGTLATHHHTDHLGTVRLLTSDTDGSVVARHDYLPYGEELTQLGEGDKMRFTGHERDFFQVGAGSGADDLDYMHARHFSPITGRFLSVDSAPGAPLHPGSWNRFGYVLGRPLITVDPDGRLPFAAFRAWVARVFKLKARDLTKVGPHRAEGVAGTASRRLTAQQRRDLRAQALQRGCHTCGTKSFGTRSGNPIGDHQPPVALAPPGANFQLYPQCATCSGRQGVQVRGILNGAAPQSAWWEALFRFLPGVGGLMLAEEGVGLAMEGGAAAAEGVEEVALQTEAARGLQVREQMVDEIEDLE